MTLALRIGIAMLASYLLGSAIGAGLGYLAGIRS